MRWTERVMEIRATGGHTVGDYLRACDPSQCLVGEAGALLGLRYYDETSNLLAGRPGIPVREDGGAGGALPALLALGRYAEAEALCLAVEDALLQIKREGSAHPATPEA